jgi:hydrogenase maturation protease
MRTSGKRPRILVAGLGNLLLGDDGVGVHLVRALEGGAPRGVMAVEVGTAVLDALPLFERADKVLALDAMEAGGAPGDLYLFPLEDAADPAVKPSLHDFGLRSAFEFLPGRRPEALVLGVEPGEIAYSLDLSPAVAAALPRALAEIRSILERWTADR